MQNHHPNTTLKKTKPIQLIPKVLVWLLAQLLAVFLIHTPEAEPVHDLSQGIILVIELNRSSYVEHDL